MRYRIQIVGMLDCTLCTVTEIVEYRGTTSHATKMYTIEGHPEDLDGLVEILGQLQRLIAEATP
jgi:hypothetical protein